MGAQVFCFEDHSKLSFFLCYPFEACVALRSLAALLWRLQMHRISGAQWQTQLS